MKTEIYIENAEKRLSKYFNTKRMLEYQGVSIDLYAESFVRNEKYFATKKATLYAFENNEYIFIKSYKNLDENHLNDFVNLLKRAVDDFVNPHNEHMSTIITGILLLEDGPEESLKREIERFKFTRSFAFGFKGWSYIRLVAVDLNKGEVITNKRGREVKKFYKVG